MRFALWALRALRRHDVAVERILFSFTRGRWLVLADRPNRLEPIQDRGNAARSCRSLLASPTRNTERAPVSNCAGARRPGQQLIVYCALGCTELMSTRWESGRASVDALRCSAALRSTAIVESGGWRRARRRAVGLASWRPHPSPSPHHIGQQPWSCIADRPAHSGKMA